MPVKSSSQKVLIQSWVPRDVAERVRARARAAQRSVAGEIRYVLADIDALTHAGPSARASANNTTTTTMEER